MRSTFLTLLMAVQLAAVPAFAQTSGTTTGTSGAGMTSDTFGSDWSTTLGLALFAEGGTMVRSDSELASQWQTLSDEDKNMIRRDCMLYMQQSGGTITGTTGTTTGSSMGSTAGSAAGTTSGASATGSGAMINVTMEQMEQICAATKDL